MASLTVRRRASHAHLSVVCIHQRSYELSCTRAYILYTNDVIRRSKKDPTAWHCVGGSVFY